MADKRSISIFLALASLVATSLIFQVASPLPHFWAAFPRTLVDNCFITIQVFSRNVDTVVLRLFRALSKRFGQHRTAKIFPGLGLARRYYRLSHWSEVNPIPQKLTLLGGWPYLKCLHGKKLALLGGLPYQADRVTLARGWPYLSCKPNRKTQKARVTLLRGCPLLGGSKWG